LQCKFKSKIIKSLKVNSKHSKSFFKFLSKNVSSKKDFEAKLSINLLLKIIKGSKKAWKLFLNTFKIINKKSLIILNSEIFNSISERS